MRRKGCHPRSVWEVVLDHGSFHASFKLGEAPRQKLGLIVRSLVYGSLARL
jgi:hypothetical protein